MSNTADNRRLIAVTGATGQQGGAVVRALQAGGQFRVRALSRNPDEHRDLADEIVQANLDQPETLKAAFQGVHGVFLVTKFLERRDRRAQAGNGGDKRRQERRCPTPRLVNADPKVHGGHASRQSGDPERLAQALLTLAAVEHRPRRFVGGADAVDMCERTLRSRTAELNDWRTLSLSLAHRESLEGVPS